MSDSYSVIVLGIVAVLSFLGTLGTVVPLFAELFDVPISKWNSPWRLLTAAGLLLVTFLTGIPVYRDVSRRHITQDVPATEIAVSTQTISQTLEPVPVSGPVPTVTTPPTVPAQKKEPATAPAAVLALPRSEESPREEPRRDVRDKAGVRIPELELIAQRLRPQEQVKGLLSETSEQSAELQGLYTVYLTLDVQFTKAGELQDAFTLQSHGGGFQLAAARVQARERLAQTFRERLEKQQ